AQEIEKQIRTIWAVLDENRVEHRHSAWLASRLHDVAEEIARLEVGYDDWQTVYRQALQLGRALDGERPLLAGAEGIAAEPVRERAPMRMASPLRALSTTELIGEITSRSALLVRKEMELARHELKRNLASELATAKGLAVAVVAGLATLNLLLVAAVHALATQLPAWGAALALGGGTLL